VPNAASTLTQVLLCCFRPQGVELEPVKRSDFDVYFGLFKFAADGKAFYNASREHLSKDIG
jgi:hypothetical protein